MPNTRSVVDELHNQRVLFTLKTGCTFDNIVVRRVDAGNRGISEAQQTM